MPPLALLASFIVGPVGVGLGAWSITRTRRKGAPTSRLAVAAIVIGIVQTVALASWALSGGPQFAPEAPPASAPTSQLSPASPESYPSTPPPSGPVDPPPLAPDKPLPTSLDEVVRTEVGPHEGQDFTQDQAAIDAGAVDAQTGVYTQDDESIKARFSLWATAEEAAQHAKEAGAAQYGDDALRGSGTFSYGSWWYFERDGVGTVFWNEGAISASFTGTPRDVQQFFLDYPK